MPCFFQITVVFVKLRISHGNPGEKRDDLTGCNNTCETGVITYANLKNDSLLEEKTTDINVFQEFETTQFNTDELNSSILFNGEDCEQVGIEKKETTREKCHELTKNMSDSYINVTESLFTNIIVPLGLMFVGGLAFVLNFIVIIVVYSTPKLRRNTYLNLVLSLSGTVFGLSTL